MDLSLEELGWLLQGIRERPPKGWSLISNRSESMRIIQAEKEISISFDLQGRILSLEKFNETYPDANLAGINKILEDTVESLVRNLYTPLTLTNLLISVQELLKGKIPRSSV